MRADKKQIDRMRRRLESLPREQLEAEPNCGQVCRGTGHEFSCGCDRCGEMNGYFEQGERGDDPMYEKLRTDNGWYGPAGCTLPRAMRSGKCLKTVCNYAVRRAIADG